MVALNALQAIDDEHPYPIAKHAIVQISRVLTQPEQEPVAWMVRDYVDGFRYVSSTESPSGTIAGLSEPLYTAPPSKPWVGLTDEEIAQAVGSPIDEVYLVDFRKVEAALRSKNT